MLDIAPSYKYNNNTSVKVCISVIGFSRSYMVVTHQETGRKLTD